MLLRSSREKQHSLSVALLATVLALLFLTASFAFAPVAHAQALPPRDTRTWQDPNGGPSFTFSTLAIRDDCTTRGDLIYTSGMRAGWRLSGTVSVRRPDNTAVFSVIPVNQTGDLNLLVLYPPISQWQQNPGNVEVHVDMAISVFDENNNLVTWVGGDQSGAPGVLGPAGQDWDIFCANPPTPAIDIVKYTNGADANDPNAAGVPLVAVGAAVTWAYDITNTGPVDIPFAEITVTDNIPGVSPVFSAIVSGDGKGDGSAILQPGEVWRYIATGVAINLSNPPQNQGLVLVPNVCREGDAQAPGRTAYTNIGTVQIPNMSADDPSSYCNTFTSISVLKTADPTHIMTTTWEISKSVSPAVIDLFEGEDAVVDYTVQVTPTVTDEAFSVTGSISITNTGAEATSVSNVVDTINGFGSVPVSCPGGLPQTLAPGAVLVCTYASALPDSVSRTNSVVVTFTDGTRQATAPVVFGPPTVINGVVNIDDTYNGGTPGVIAQGVTSATTIEYTRTVVCGSDLGYEGGVASFTRANTARIIETNQTADASMRVNCYRPSVDKTADPEFTRRYEWQINKVAVPTEVDLVDGQSAPVTYTVVLTKAGPVDENFRVFGSITVNNPHPSAALQLTGITDRLGNGQSVTVNCPATSVPPSGSLACTYSSNLPNNADGTNTAIVTATTGIAYSSPVVAYSFTGVQPSQTLLNSVTVTDTNPATGQPWTFSGSGAQSYTVPFACTDITYDQNGLFQKTVANTAVITQTGQEASADVNLTCQLPRARLTGACIVGVSTWLVATNTTGAYVVEFRVGNNVTSTLNLALVANTPTTFTYDGNSDDLSSVQLLFNGHVIVTVIGPPAPGIGCSPTSLPPSDEPNGGATNWLYLPVITSR